MPKWPENPDDPVDPAIAPLIEAGEGEAEGFEVAEADLIEHAEHGDQHGTDPISGATRRASPRRRSRASTTTATARRTTRTLTLDAPAIDGRERRGDFASPSRCVAGRSPKSHPQGDTAKFG